jgi:hypothetical protein
MDKESVQPSAMHKQSNKPGRAATVLAFDAARNHNHDGYADELNSAHCQEPELIGCHLVLNL